MSPPWMPLYVADYLQDTTHLQALESGAYLHLIMAYWSAGKLPNDDRQLATIAKMTPPQWKRARPLLEAFFGTGFTSHKRIDHELKRTAEVSAAYSARAAQAANKRWSKHASSNAPSMLEECLDMPSSQPQPQPQKGVVETERPTTPISKNLADAVGGRKPTRPSIDGFFDQFWKVYPKRGDAANPKKPAHDKFERAIRGGTEPAQIIAAAQRYCEIESAAGRTNTEKIAQAVTWLNQQRWNDYPQAPPAGTPLPPDPSMPSDAELRARHAKRIPDDPKPEDAGLFREGNGAHSADEEALRH